MTNVADLDHALDFDMLSPEALDNPWQFLTPIQEQDPVFWSEKQRAWIFTRHADIMAAYRDKRFSVTRMSFFIDRLAEQIEGGIPLTEKYIPQSVNFIDPPDLNRVRMLMFQAFQPKSVELIRPAIRAAVAELLDKARKLETFDFMSEIAIELPMRMLTKILGVPDQYRSELLDLVSANSEGLGSSAPGPANMLRFEKALKRSFDIFSVLIKEREVEPQADFLTALVQARDQQDRFSHDELLVACFTIMAAGVETTAGGLGLFLRKIAETPSVLAYLRENPDKVRNVVDELNRYPAEVKGMLRIALEDFAWGGKQIREGDMIFLMHSAGNTDPLVFPNPFDIDPTRDTKASLGWGTGFHSCIGQLFAKVELDEFLAACFEQFDVEILQEKFEYLPSFALIIYKELQVRFTPRSLAKAA